MERRQLTEEQLTHLPEVHRLIAERFIREGRWELVESAPGRYKRQNFNNYKEV